MEYVTLEVTLCDSPTTFVSKVPVLIRKDWVFDYDNPNGKLGKWDEVDINQCIKNENGDWVFVYPFHGTEVTY